VNFILKYISILLSSGLWLSCFQGSAQLEFCSGNSGDTIFTETFGVGTSPGPALASDITTYFFTPGIPSDGSYTISNTTDYFDWHDTTDHTPNDSNGKALIVNADLDAGEFYKKTIDGLCENTSYEFSSWVLNLLPPSLFCPNLGIPINVKFQIWDNTDTELLATGDTGNIAGTNSPEWNRYGLLFKTQPGQTSVILKMINNGNGGCGNDLAIDDIVFKSCGDTIALTNELGESLIASCEEDGAILSTALTATPDFSIFNSHAYQWQESLDGTTWVNITGETTNTYVTPVATSSRFYRVKVAEDAINVSNAFCNVVSETFRAIIVPIADPPITNGNLALCANLLQPLSASVPNDNIVDWYDAPIGGNLLLENSTSFLPEVSGTYYAEASSNLVNCFSKTRTAFTYEILELPQVSDENLVFCEDIPIKLSADTNNASYNWNTGETTESIEVATQGAYTVTVTNQNGCSSIKTIVLQQIDQPIIDTISTIDENIIVSVTNTSELEYSLNNGPFQDNPVFELVQGGLYTVNVRGKNDCPIIGQEFLHFVVPKFFTPNGDSFNDVFLLQGLEFFASVEVQIFDRYGTLLKQTSGTSFSWDGTFRNKPLPSSDYWYKIRADDQEFRGHFSLKR
jgi:gliding motility-associated-like protein